MIGAATVSDTIREAARRLDGVGIENASAEARLLLGHVLGQPREAMLVRRDEPLDERVIDAVATLVERRARHEPMSHILGQREFWGLPLSVGPVCLDPRPDSETLIEAALSRISDRATPLSVLDLGTGSGCLLLALLSELPRATGTGVDLSEEALAVARRNAAALGLQDRAAFAQGDWGTAVAGRRFDIVLCNPPYIRTSDIDGLQPEVALFEPRLALDGGVEGLDCYRRLAPQLGALLAPAGIAVVEIGKGQHVDVTDLFAAAGLTCLEVRRDLGGVDRCLTLAFGAVNHI